MPITQTRRLKSAIAVTASGVAVNFLNIPASAKRLNLAFKDISTNGTSQIVVRLGSGSIDATGYLGAGSVIGSSTGVTNVVTSGLGIIFPAIVSMMSGIADFVLLDSGTNTWVGRSTTALSNTNNTQWSAASKILAGAIDRLQVTTANGTDIFDSGTINLIWE